MQKLRAHAPNRDKKGRHRDSQWKITTDSGAVASHSAQECYCWRSCCCCTVVVAVVVTAVVVGIGATIVAVIVDVVVAVLAVIAAAVDLRFGVLSGL